MRVFTLAKSRKVAVELGRAPSSKIDASEAPRVAPELPQRPLAHSGAVLTWTRVGGTELRVGAPAPARGERCQARPEPPPWYIADPCAFAGRQMIHDVRRMKPSVTFSFEHPAGVVHKRLWFKDFLKLGLRRSRARPGAPSIYLST